MLIVVFKNSLCKKICMYIYIYIYSNEISMCKCFFIIFDYILIVEVISYLVLIISKVY